MKTRRDWFYSFSILCFEMIVLAGLAFGLVHIGAGKEYPYLARGGWLLLVLLLAGGMYLLGSLWARLSLGERIGRHERLCAVIEWGFGLLILLAGAGIRLLYMRDVPLTPLGDFKDFYEIAGLLSRAQLAQQGAYCDYIALFPQVMGYPRLLATLFGVTGASVQAALGVNIALQGLTLLLVWRVARALAGRLAGLFALLVAAFWPSTVLYSSFIAADAAFAFFLMLGVWLLVRQDAPVRADEKRPFREFTLLILAGVALGFAARIRAAALVYVAAVVVYMRTGKSWLPEKPRNDISLGLRATHRGWQRAIILLVSFLAVSLFGRASTQYAVDRRLARPDAALGYELMEGVNIQSAGGWSQEDSDYLYSALAETGSATAAQLACRDLAFERIGADPMGVLNLMAGKLETLMGNDEYAASMTTLCLGEMGALDEATRDRYYSLMELCDAYYLAALLLAGIAGLLCFIERVDFSYTLILLMNGAVFFRLLLSSQNSDHYFLLPVLCLLSAVALNRIMALARRHVLGGAAQREREAQSEAERRERLRRIEAQERELAQLRAEALHAQFDMGSAIKEGHIRVIVSEAVANETQKGEN